MSREVEEKLAAFVERRHREAFDERAPLKGAHRLALNDLYQATGYVPETEQPDTNHLDWLIEKQRLARPYMFGNARENAVHEGTEIIADDDPRWGDAAWQMRNRDKIVASANAKAKLAEIAAGRYSDSTIIEDDDPRLSDSAWQMLHRDEVVASAKAKLARDGIE